MDVKTEILKRNELMAILSQLASDAEYLSSQEHRDNIYKRLDNIYSNNEFRHFYSDILSAIININNEKSSGNIDVLNENLRQILNGYNVDTKNNIRNNLKKLYDCVNSEVIRINNTKKEFNNFSSEEKVSEIQKELNKQTEYIKDFAKETNESIDSVSNRIKNQERDYVAILGIFAAIVLAFTSGISFTTATLENINNLSIKKLLIIILSLGLVLVSVLMVLFSFINRIVNSKNNCAYLVGFLLALTFIVIILLLVCGIIQVGTIG